MAKIQITEKELNETIMKCVKKILNENWSPIYLSNGEYDGDEWMGGQLHNETVYYPWEPSEPTNMDFSDGIPFECEYALGKRDDDYCNGTGAYDDNEYASVECPEGEKIAKELSENGFEEQAEELRRFIEEVENNPNEYLDDYL